MTSNFKHYYVFVNMLDAGLDYSCFLLFLTWFRWDTFSSHLVSKSSRFLTAYLGFHKQEKEERNNEIRQISHFYSWPSCVTMWLSQLSWVVQKSNWGVVEPCWNSLGCAILIRADTDSTWSGLRTRSKSANLSQTRLSFQPWVRTLGLLVRSNMESEFS